MTASSPPGPFERLDPTLDLVFKLLFTREPALLIDMLEGILGRSIRGLEIVDREIPGDEVRDKRIVLDLRVILDDGMRVVIEMQGRPHAGFTSRVVYYGAREYVDQLGRGDDYRELRPTAVIVWLVQPLRPALDGLHSIVEFWVRHTQARFSDQLTLHVLQLGTLSGAPATGYHEQKVERWARFFEARGGAALDSLAAEDPIMALAKQTLEEISQDPAAQRRARRRADQIALYEIERKMERDQYEAGIEAAFADGKAKILLKLLGVRFGPPSGATRAAVEAASVEQLDAWAERVLTATTLEDVLGAEDPTMALAEPTLELLSPDSAAPRSGRWVDRSKLHELERMMERKAGLAEGQAKGQAKLLLKLLHVRFGPPSEATRAAVEAASVEQLDAWAERVLKATTLEDVLAP